MRCSTITEVNGKLQSESRDNKVGVVFTEHTRVVVFSMQIYKH